MSVRFRALSAALLGLLTCTGAANADSARLSVNYPRESLKAGEQGRVGFTVDVTAAGRAINCKVTESSGYRRLDKATCDEFEGYARFAPARDADGKAITGSYSGHIDWVINSKHYKAEEKPTQPPHVGQ